MKKFPSMEHIPAHVRASWTPEEREYYETVAGQPRLGREWVVAHRKIEMLLADQQKRDFFLGYWPENALAYLGAFKAKHYDAEPDRGHYAESTLVDRLRKYYPGLFEVLDTRVGSLREAATTHPHLQTIAETYAGLKAEYFRLLTAAELLAGSGKGLPQKEQKRINKKKHDYFREAFARIYPDLHDLIAALCNSRR